VLLYLLRHAEAEPHSADDFSRKLTGKGEKQARKIGLFLAERDIKPDLILTSPVLRAKQTAALAAEELKGEAPTEVPWLTCGMNPVRALAELAGYAKLESLLVVGHEPDFSALVAHLLDLGSGASVHISKSSLTCIELSRPVAGSGILRFLIPVKLLERTAD
jgi:phosphohistidine phosphatase